MDSATLDAATAELRRKCFANYDDVLDRPAFDITVADASFPGLLATSVVTHGMFEDERALLQANGTGSEMKFYLPIGRNQKLAHVFTLDNEICGINCIGIGLETQHCLEGEKESPEPFGIYVHAPYRDK